MHVKYINGFHTKLSLSSSSSLVFCQLMTARTHGLTSIDSPHIFLFNVLMKEFFQPYLSQQNMQI